MACLLACGQRKIDEGSVCWGNQAMHSTKNLQRTKTLLKVDKSRTRSSHLARASKYFKFDERTVLPNAN